MFDSYWPHQYPTIADPPFQSLRQHSEDSWSCIGTVKSRSLQGQCHASVQSHQTGRFVAESQGSHFSWWDQSPRNSADSWKSGTQYSFASDLATGARVASITLYEAHTQSLLALLPSMNTKTSKPPAPEASSLPSAALPMHLMGPEQPIRAVLRASRETPQSLLLAV
jgi:hypothetical protein